MNLAETVETIMTISWVIIYVVRAQNIRLSGHSPKTLMAVKAQKMVYSNFRLTGC